MKNTTYIKYWHIISFCFLCLLASCKSLSDDIDDNVITYKSAAFRSWLLFDTIDNFYTPPSKSLAIYLAPYGKPRESLYLIGNPEPSEKNLNESHYHLPGKKVAYWLHRPAVLAEYGIKYTKRLPSSYPWEVDMSWDINTYMEGLDLNWLAKLCYQNKPGCIYLMPGYRKYFTVPIPFLLGGYVSPNIFLPARLITRSELDLSVIMDNIWLLYQLEREGWVMRTGKKTWEWSDKAKALTNKSSTHTITQLTDKERSYFKVLDHIGRGDTIPPIPCEVFHERHVIHPLDAEICQMRQIGTIYEGSSRSHHDLEGEAVVRYAPEAGINILLKINNKGIKNTWKSIVSLEEFGTNGDIMKEYGCANCGLFEKKETRMRVCRKIYDQ